MSSPSTSCTSPSCCKERKRLLKAMKVERALTGKNQGLAEVAVAATKLVNASASALTNITSGIITSVENSIQQRQALNQNQSVQHVHIYHLPQPPSTYAHHGVRMAVQQNLRSETMKPFLDTLLTHHTSIKLLYIYLVI